MLVGRWPLHRCHPACVRSQRQENQGAIKVDLRSPVSASQSLMVWSHDALQISSASDHSTEEMASVWPERVARGVLVSPSCSVFCFFRGLLAASSISSSSSVGTADQIFNILSQDPLQNLVLVQSTATDSTLPACPLQQWRAFTLFFSTFHSQSRTVWSMEALSNRHDKLSCFTHATSFTTSVCPAIVRMDFPSTDQIRAVWS